MTAIDFEYRLPSRTTGRGLYRDRLSPHSNRCRPNRKQCEVVEPLPVSVPIPPEAVVPTLIDTQEHLIEVAQERLSSLASESGPPPARWSIEVGTIKTEILRVAREHHIDLIVLGSREKHGLAFIFGPIEDGVLHGAPCDVLAVRVV
jgi:universal stress protein A